MNLKYVENFVDGKVTLLIYSNIGLNSEGEGVSGEIFASTMNYLQSDPSVIGIDVKINSHGGGLLDAIMIFNAIRDSKKPCNTIIDGIAASSGGLIAMAGHKRYITDFGRLMVHAPQLSNKLRSSLDKNTIKMLDQFQDLIADLLTANSKHDKESINRMIDAETWFTSKQALKDGFVDEVINTDRNFSEIFNGLDLAKADLALVVNQISNHKQKPIKMDLSKVKNSLGLDQSVSEDVVNDAIAKIVNAKNTAETSLATEKAAHGETKSKLTEAQNKVKTVEDAAATDYVENCIKEGKFNADKKDDLIKQAQNDLAGFKVLAESMATPAKNIIDKIDPTKDAEAAKAGEVVNGMLDGKTFRQLEKEAPKVLNALRTNEPKKYEALYKAQYPTA